MNADRRIGEIWRLDFGCGEDAFNTFYTRIYSEVLQTAGTKDEDAAIADLRCRRGEWHALHRVFF